MSARLDPNELGAAGAILSAAEGVFRVVRGLDARLPDAYRSLALALDRLAMTSHTIPVGTSDDEADLPPAFDSAKWEAEVRQRFDKLTLYNAVEPLAEAPGTGVVTVGNGEEDLLGILEDLERFAYFAGRDRLEAGLLDLRTSRPHWMGHLRNLQKLLEALGRGR